MVDTIVVDAGDAETPTPAPYGLLQCDPFIQDRQDEESISDRYLVPPQVQLHRANVVTDCISDRVFSREVLKHNISQRKRPGRPRRARVHATLRKLSVSARLRFGRLDFVPPQLQKGQANIVTDCISDRQFENGCRLDQFSFPPPPPPPAFERPSRERRPFRRINEKMSQAVDKFLGLGDCKNSTYCTSCKGSSASSQCSNSLYSDTSDFNEVLKVASIGCTLGDRLENASSEQRNVQNSLQGDLPIPRPTIVAVLEPVEASVVPLGSKFELPQSQIELSHMGTSNEYSVLQGERSGGGDDSFVLQSLADGAPDASVSIGSLSDLRGTHSTQRHPRLKNVCLSCRPLIHPRCGRWLRYCACPHRLPRASRPRPPKQMLMLLKKEQRRERRERPRWSHLDGKRRKRCVHGFLHGFGNASKCKKCRECPHGKLKDSCNLCSGCVHGFARGSCKTCSGCIHGKLKSACVKCSPCPHGRLRRNCKECISCIHGRNRNFCLECSPCPHGRLKYDCVKCNGCEHGLLKRFCETCCPCPHGRRKDTCVECVGCSHGVLKFDCRHCSGCPHNRVRRFCAECNPCPHGKRKASCKLCNPCPHGRIKNSCKDCNGCEHGTTRRFCRICNGCAHGKLRRFCKICTPSLSASKS